VTWAIRYTPAADRDIDALDPPIRRRVLTAIGRLALDPHRAANVKALRGGDLFRLRVGDWRVIYTLRDEALIILVVRVGHRGEVYD